MNAEGYFLGALSFVPEFYGDVQNCYYGLNAKSYSQFGGGMVTLCHVLESGVVILHIKREMVVYGDKMVAEVTNANNFP